MRALIGDNSFNQRFLRVLVTAAGFDDIAGSANAEDLLREAALGADLVIYDPRMDRTDPDLDVGLELLRFVPRTRLVVVSPSPADLERARRDGIVAARKQSFYHLEEIEGAILLVTSRIAAEAAQKAGAGPPATMSASRQRAQRIAAAAPVDDGDVIELFDRNELLRTTTSANAPVAAVPVPSTP